MRRREKRNPLERELFIALFNNCCGSGGIIGKMVQIVKEVIGRLLGDGKVSGHCKNDLENSSG